MDLYAQRRARIVYVWQASERKRADSVNAPRKQLSMPKASDQRIRSDAPNVRRRAKRAEPS
eukprot:7841583-Alexandrium_andersonii.AAC.1